MKIINNVQKISSIWTGKKQRFFKEKGPYLASENNFRIINSINKNEL